MFQYFVLLAYDKIAYLCVASELVSVAQRRGTLKEKGVSKAHRPVEVARDYKKYPTKQQISF